MHFEIPKKVEIIINTLEDAGFEAYAVGGCVRDAHLLHLDRVRLDRPAKARQERDPLVVIAGT